MQKVQEVGQEEPNNVQEVERKVRAPSCLGVRVEGMTVLGSCKKLGVGPVLEGPKKHGQVKGQVDHELGPSALAPPPWGGWGT